MIQIIYCDTYQHFLDLHKELLLNNKNNRNLRIYYRGQANSCWELEPTLSRDSKRIFNPVTYTNFLLNEEKFLENEYVKINEIISSINFDYAYKAIINTESISWELDNRIRDLWIYARHQGKPSPLLDFTYSLDVATYFAAMNKKNWEHIAIFMILEQNYEPSDPDGIKNAENIFVRSIKPPKSTVTSERHIRQQSLYIISTLLGSNKNRHTFQNISANQIVKGAISKFQIYKFIIPSTEQYIINKKLPSDWINDDYLFTTL